MCKTDEYAYVGERPSEDYHIRKNIPNWMEELRQNHKSTWEANSKGGEPNHRNS